MAYPGTKPQPTHLKLLKGNPGLRKLPENEPKPAIAFPEPLPHLTDEAKVEWRRLGSELYALGLLTNLDLGVLAAYCQSYALWKAAIEVYKEAAQMNPASKGLLALTTNKNLIQNPIVGTINKCASDMVRYAAEFGMTPSARSRLTNDFDPPPSKFDGLIGAKNKY